MKKKKLLFYISIMVVLIAFLTVGVVSFLVGDTYKNNNIVFYLDSTNAYSRIQGKYFYNNEEQIEKAYDQSYTEEDELSKNGVRNFETWDIGISSFTGQTDFEEFKYEIVITNLNNNNPINISLSNVAVGEQIKNNEKIILFYTTITYQMGNEAPTVMFSNKEGSEVNYGLYAQGTKSVSLSDKKQIDIEKSLKITVQIERKTKVESFTIDNNMQINLSAPETKN